MRLLTSRAINREALPSRQASVVVLTLASHPVVSASKGRLSEADAVDIWIARWLRIRRKDLIARYGCDPRRLYEIWEERRFVGSRGKALAVFNERHPGLADRVDFGLHRRIPKAIPPELQPGLFDGQPAIS